jgi:hypothetical protein
MTWVFNDTVLSIPSAGLEVTLGMAEVFPAKEPLSARLDSWSALNERTRLTAQNPGLRSGISGLLPLSQFVSRIVRGEPPPQSGLDRWCQAGWLALQTILRGLESDSRLRTREGVLGLLGLGVGLTPSGDDVLLGLVGILLHLPGRTCAVEMLAQCIVEECRSRTSLVSCAYLEHAARGEFGERVSRFVTALIGGPTGALTISLQDLLSWGHTSGGEIVLGSILGAEWAYVRYAESSASLDARDGQYVPIARPYTAANVNQRTQAVMVDRILTNDYDVSMEEVQSGNTNLVRPRGEYWPVITMWSLANGAMV